MMVKINCEKLTYKEIYDFLKDTRKYFRYLATDVQLEARVQKLYENATFMTARNGGDLVGIIAFYMNMQPLCYITQVCIKEPFQHKGILNMMLTALEDIARKNGFQKIELEVYKSNLHALERYRVYNFSISEDRGEKFLLYKSLGVHRQ